MLTRKRLPEGVLDQAIARVRFTDDPLPQSIRTMARWSHELGFARREPQLDTIFEHRFDAAPAAAGDR